MNKLFIEPVTVLIRGKGNFQNPPSATICSHHIGTSLQKF